MHVEVVHPHRLVPREQLPPPVELLLRARGIEQHPLLGGEGAGAEVLRSGLVSGAAIVVVQEQRGEPTGEPTVDAEHAALVRHRAGHGELRRVLCRRALVKQGGVLLVLHHQHFRAVGVQNGGQAGTVGV